jgi:hypothetical protein
MIDDVDCYDDECGAVDKMRNDKRKLSTRKILPKFHSAYHISHTT